MKENPVLIPPGGLIHGATAVFASLVVVTELSLSYFRLASQPRSECVFACLFFVWHPQSWSSPLSEGACPAVSSEVAEVDPESVVWTGVGPLPALAAFASILSGEWAHAAKSATFKVMKPKRRRLNIRGPYLSGLFPSYLFKVFRVNTP